jgi:hypothetical protein
MKDKKAEDKLPQILPLAKLDGHLGEEVTAVDCRVPLGTLVDWSFDEDKIMVSCCCMH